MSRDKIKIGIFFIVKPFILFQFSFLFPPVFVPTLHFHSLFFHILCFSSYFLLICVAVGSVFPGKTSFLQLEHK